MSHYVSNFRSSRKAGPKSLCYDARAPSNRYDQFASTISDAVSYDTTQFKRPAQATTYRHDPYTLKRLLSMAVVNLPFERAAHIENDLMLLFQYISHSIIPLHAKERKDTCPPAFYYAKFVGCRVDDSPCDINGYPSKDRYFMVETNYPLLNELLHDHRLYVLADRLCFHVCWNGKQVVSGEGDDLQMYTHNVHLMRQNCDIIRSLGLRARHRATDGLPSTAMKFDCLM